MNAQIIVVGGGPVGLTFALAASKLRGVDITVLERGPVIAQVDG